MGFKRRLGIKKNLFRDNPTVIEQLSHPAKSSTTPRRFISEKTSTLVIKYPKICVDVPHLYTSVYLSEFMLHTLKY